MKKISVFYVLTLAIVGLAIVGILHLGESLPGSSSTNAVQAPTPVSSAHDVSALSSMMEGLQFNIATPFGHLFVQLLVIIAVSQLIGKLFIRLGQPAVVGEMAAGIVLGPSLFGWLVPQWFAFVFPQDSLGMLKLLSQIGVCLFMFAVGMEVNVKHVRNKAHVALVVSHVSIIFPYLLGVLLAYFLFTSMSAPGATFTTFALFMGISMSITAFPVLARILQERGLSKTALGSTAITCAAIDDVTAWSILAFVVAIAGATSISGSALNLLLVLIFVAMMIFGVRRILLHQLGNGRAMQDEPSKGTLGIIVCVVMAAALTTEVIGIHALFGAFLAGATMPNTHDFRQKINVRVEAFSSVLLLPLFFVFTGLRTQIGLIDDVQGWLMCLLIVAIATLGKLGGSAIAARLAGMKWNESLQLGALMNTRGLMELIALNIGYDMNILAPRIFTMLVIMALATTMLTGPLLTFFEKRQAAENKAQELPGA